MRNKHFDDEKLLPFHEWKARAYKEDQENCTPRTKEEYYTAYGAYCVKMRQLGKAA